MRTLHGWMLAVVACLVFAGASHAQEAAQKYDLKYKFAAGETIRSKITHTSDVHTTIKNTHETATSRAESEKVWQVSSVSPSGEATFVYSVEYVVMRGKVGDYAEVVYDSRKDIVAPEVYKGVAKTLRTPIAEIKIDERGRVLSREVKLKDAPANVSGGSVTLPMPNEPIAIGHAWYDDFKIPVKVDGAAGKKIDREIKARQKYKLESVTNGVARISVVTQILDPALPAAVEVQLVQRVLSGDVKFDIAQGRIVAQTMKVDGNVIDFHGAGSLMKCKMEISEELVSAKVETASKPEAAETKATEKK
jgi:hypothetical protein